MKESEPHASSQSAPTTRAIFVIGHVSRRSGEAGTNSTQEPKSVFTGAPTPLRLCSTSYLNETNQYVVITLCVGLSGGGPPVAAHLPRIS